MNFFADIFLPLVLLVLVMGSQLAAILYPHYAINTPQGIAVVTGYSKDPKLQAIANYWAFRLVPAQWESYRLTAQLSRQIAWQLARHRYLTGDEPSRLYYRPRLSGILVEALRQSGAVKLKTPPDLLITPVSVTTSEGAVIWQQSNN